MRGWPVLLVACLSLVALAGCGAPAAGPPAAEPAEPERQSRAEEDVVADAENEVEVASGRRQETGAPVVTWKSYSTRGTTTANAAGWGLDTALGLGVRAMNLYLPPNATALVVELEWDDAVQDLDVEAHAQGGDGLAARPECGVGSALGPVMGSRAWCDFGGSLAAPDVPSRLDLHGLELADCEPAGLDWGDCNVFALGFRSKDANALLEWHLIATVFFEGPPPEAFSALAP
jgi:predicted small lipoprotein YifL